MNPSYNFIKKTLLCFGFLFLLLRAHSQEFFRHISNLNNTLGDYTEINQLKTNGHPEAILVITRVANIGKSKERPVFGVEYKEGKWRLFSKNGMGVPLNAVFFIAVKNVPDDNCFTLAESIPGQGGKILINSKLTINDSSTSIFITEKRDRYTTCYGTTARVNIGKGKWYIQTESKTSSGGVIKFNVLIETPSNPPKNSFKSYQL